tara:strand:+ start:737 stop:1588 length:852 start_codon:yes stop_codon:yes gene_type:complete
MKVNKLAVLGDPIKHSLSPKIHNYWLKKMRINGRYQAIKTPIKNLKKVITKLCNNGYTGSNLTIPLKEEALKYINKKDKITTIIGAANVLIFSKTGNIEGKNTDVYGFKKSIMNLIKNKKRSMAIVIGTGGAARAVVCALIEMNYKKVFLFYRTKKKAESIKYDFSKNYKNTLKTKIYCNDIKKIEKSLKKTDILINTTPMGMKGFPSLNIDIKKLNINAAVIDLIYNPLETKLIKESKKRGIKNSNGLDMLIYQAQKSFYYWLNKTPKVTGELKKILEKEIR